MSVFFNFIKSFTINDWLLIIFSMLVVVGNSGIWPMPNLSAQYAVSQSLFNVPFQDPNAHYIFLNYFQPMLFGALGGNGLVQYALFTGFITLIFLVTFILWFINYHGKEVALNQIKVILAVSFPVFMIPFYWIGMDGMTLLLMLLIMIALNTRFFVLPAFLLGLQHFEQGVVAFSLLLFSLLLPGLFNKQYLLEKKVILIRTFFVLLSVVLGKVILSIWFFLIDAGLSGDRSSYLENHLQLYISMWKNWWYLIPWTLLGVGWFVLFKFFGRLWPLFLVLVSIFLFVAVVGDQTRVGLLVAFPAIFYWIFMDRALWLSLSQPFVVSLIVLNLLLPVVVVWGQPHGSLIQHDKILIDKLLNNTFSLERFDWVAPFKGANVGSESDPKLINNPKSNIIFLENNVVCEELNSCSINVMVTNTGEERWSAKSNTSWGVVNLSYHVQKSDGSIFLFDGFRTPLPHDQASGVSVPLKLVLPNTLKEGTYVIQADMVQEGVSWFSSKDADNSSFIVVSVKPKVY